MFGKKKCKRCGEKVGKEDSFCPSCGMDLRGFERKEEDLGMLGRNDFLSPEMNMPGFNMIFNSIMKDFGSQFKTIEKELRKDLEKGPSPGKRGISISISTSGNSPPKIRINNLNGGPINQYAQENPNKKREKKSIFLSEEKAKEFLKLPQEEPITKIRRLSNKVIYEVELPGVKSLKDLSIMQLERSIELKALSKRKAYKKIIPVDFPIQSYKLLKEKLILELGVKN
ncbi:MAG: zinc ribbon domain-containing protein [archaeon]